MSGRILTVLAGLAVNALLTRLLTPNEVGAYFLTLSVVWGASIIAQLGLNHSVVRLVAESLSLNKPRRAKETVQFVLLLVSAGVCGVVAILYFGVGDWLAMSLFKSPLMAGIIGLTMIWIAVTAFQQISAEIFRGFQDIRLASAFGGLVTSSLSAILFAGTWLVQGHTNLHQVVILSLAAGGTSVLIAWTLVWGKTQNLAGDGHLRISDILIISWPLLLTNLTLFILSQADIWILGTYHAQNSVALYGASSRLMLLISLPLMVVNAVIMPIIAELYSKRKMADLERTLQAVASVSTIPAVLVFFGFILFGRPLLSLIYGDFYRDGYPVLILLSLGQLINIMAGSCGYTLMMTGRQTIMMWISFTAGLITIGMVLLLVKSYGIRGVAFASAFGLGIQSIAMWLCVKRSLGIWTHISLRGMLDLNKIRRSA